MLSTISSFLPTSLTERLEKLDLRIDAQASRKQEGQNQNEDVDGEGAIKRRDMAAEADELNKKEKRKKSTSNETFIVVRPPPAKSNHPLNLQLQLVPAHISKERSNTMSSTMSAATTPTATANPTFPGSTSGEAASPTSPDTEHGDTQDDSDGRRLRRSPSTRSNRSDTSAFYATSNAATSVTGSVTSFASTTSTASGAGRRMIIPLYNLHAHNVMTNTIHDAGTDARVAKFGRRGLEILGLGVLEPMELWVGGKEHDLHRTNSRQSHLALPGQGGSRAGTPDQPHSPHSPGSSRLSISSEHSTSPSHSLGGDVAGAAPGSGAGVSPVSTPTGAKKFFGKIFKKKESASSSHSSSTLSPHHYAEHSLSPATSVFPTSPGLQPSTPTTPTPGNSKHSSSTHNSEIVLPAVLGLSPLLSPASTTFTSSPTGRPVSYTWVMRKWLKDENQGLISGMIGKIGKEASAHGVAISGHIGGKGKAGHGQGDGGVMSRWTVKFEWQRGRSKAERAKRREQRRSNATSMTGGGGVESTTPSRRSSVMISVSDQGHGNETPAIMLDSPVRQSFDGNNATSGGVKKKKKRRSPSAARRSISSVGHSDDDGSYRDNDDSHGHEDDVDDGEESDPEDSETPWTCYMILETPPPPPPPPAVSPSPTSSGFLRHARIRSMGNSNNNNNHNNSGTSGAAVADIVIHPSTPTTASMPIPAPPSIVKHKIATLAPAPHHPKVVCQLKVPFPLPDVEVENGTVCRRVVLGDGSMSRSTDTNRGHQPAGSPGLVPGTPSPSPLTLTAEEIKDVVCSTAFWLVVREGIGGVGKVNRKGDGWRIRG